MPVPREDLQLLAEIGFLAVSRGQIVQGEKIFKALELARPASVGGYVGLAVAQVFGGRPRDALGTLERGMRNVPAEEHAPLYAFQGYAFRCVGLHAASAQALKSAGDLPFSRALRGEPPRVLQEG